MGTWYRGESTNWKPSNPGANLHDFGDGFYLTDTQSVAELYADMRSKKDEGNALVFRVDLSASELGPVLDLKSDARWLKFIDMPIVPGDQSSTPRNLIRTQERYSQLFQDFVKLYKINLADYNAVKGDELVRGGTQLAILYKGGRPSKLVDTIRAKMQQVNGSTSTAATPTVPIVPGTGGIGSKMKSSVREMMKNQAAMAMVGVMLEGFFQWLGDRANQKNIKADLDKRADYIGASFRQGKGVLVVVWFKEWEVEDFNGGRARIYSDMDLVEGTSEQDARGRWNRQTYMSTGVPKGWRRSSQFIWVPPPDENGRAGRAVLPLPVFKLPEPPSTPKWGPPGAVTGVCKE